MDQLCDTCSIQRRCWFLFQETGQGCWSWEPAFTPDVDDDGHVVKCPSYREKRK